MRTVHLQRVVLVPALAALLGLAGCGGAVGTNAGGAGGEVYVGEGGSTTIAKTVDDNYPILGKNVKLDYDGDGIQDNYRALYTKNQINVRNSLNRLRRRVNVQSAHLAEPLGAAAMLHSAFLVTNPNSNGSNYQTVDGAFDGQPASTNPFFVEANWATRIQYAMSAYVDYNIPQELDNVIGEDGVVIGGPLTINPNFQAKEYMQRVHPDTPGYLETHTYEIGQTPLDPPLEYFWPSGAWFAYRANGIDCATLETWNLIYGRLPMMRHDMTLMGHGGRVTLTGEGTWFDTTRGELLDTLVPNASMGGWWDVALTEANGALTGTYPTMLPSFAPGTFGSTGDLQAANAAIVVKRSPDQLVPPIDARLAKIGPNMQVFTFASEANIPRFTTIWPTNREVQVWRSYEPIHETPRPPSLDAGRVYGIPVHAILPIFSGWRTLNITISIPTIDPVSGKKVPGTAISSEVLYGGNSTINNSKVSYDPNLRAGEVFIVPGNYLTINTEYMISFSGTTGAGEKFSLQWTFTTISTPTYSDSGVWHWGSGYNGTYPPRL